MRILANENIPGSAVATLRERGHDVAWVRTDAPGAPDDRVLTWATDEDRLLITFDKDFGELAFRWGLPATSGIVLFRTLEPDAVMMARIIVLAIDSREDWAGHFSVVQRDRIRMTPLP